MNRDEFLKLLEEEVIILDGATGTELQKRGLPKGVCPEKWVIENPEVIKAVQNDYIRAGSKAIYTCTFGCNRAKLSEFGLQDCVFEMNKSLAVLSKEAADKDVFVAGDLAPTGRFIEPFGDLGFDEAVEIFKEQVNGLLAGGVDFFVIETMMDIQEARAALIAVKESCDLPVCVSMTFDEEGRTMMGMDAETALVILQSLGAAAVGCNCSTGPQSMLKVVASMKNHAVIPLLAKPNAGLPRFANGKTEFDMGAEEFGSFVKNFMEIGVRLIGGCCGTSPLFIQEIVKNISDSQPAVTPKQIPDRLTTGRKLLRETNISKLNIGKQIHVKSNEWLQQELKKGNFDCVCDVALEQMDEEVDVIQLNLQLDSINETETMVNAVKALLAVVSVPLSFETANSEVLERALRLYPGRALVDVSNIDITERKEELLLVSKKYGAVVLC